MRPTHTVINQPPPLTDWDVADHPALLEGVRREGAGWAVDDLHRLGRRAGSAEAQRWGRDANEQPPRLATHDRFGHRIDEVRYHDAYHRLLDVAVSEGLAGAAWDPPDDDAGRPRLVTPPDGAAPGSAHVARAAGFHVWSHTDLGHGCPVSMSYSAVPALRCAPDLAADWEPPLTTPTYDPGLRWRDAKRGLLAGMAMTEKQGGSDVRANTTTAARTGDGSWRLTGHKWFCSAPMGDVFLVLAQAPGGLSCFLLPRVLPDGTRNAVQLQRLKDKLGNRSNASAEIELGGAVAWMAGAEGRGVATIIGMVAATRLDCVTGAASVARHAVAQALHHARHRRAFGRALVDQPLMRNVLADLAVESEAMTATMLRLAGAFGRAQAGDAAAGAVLRLAVPVAKYWVTRRSVAVAAEALECLGGNGYVEESDLPRLYREAPLNSIWEGSGNIQALDVLRAARRTPPAVEAFVAELRAGGGGDRRLDGAIDRVERHLSSADGADAAFQARTTAQLAATALQASLLVRHAPAAVADAFCATRLPDGHADAGSAGAIGAAAFGTLPRGTATGPIIDRAVPRT